jgi:ribosomal-protein-alanine N-acetyltransferase
MTQDSRGAWPIKLRDNELMLAPLKFVHRNTWNEVRNRNREWLDPWEATRPIIEGRPDTNLVLPSYFQMVRHYAVEGRALRSISLGIWLIKNSELKFIGQITLGGIVFGAMRGAHIGYWIDQKYANQGLTTRAVNLLSEYGFKELALHRIEINLRPENEASARVAQKAGFTYEGVRSRYLHINGEWRDHATYIRENSQIR